MGGWGREVSFWIDMFSYIFWYFCQPMLSYVCLLHISFHPLRDMGATWENMHKYVVENIQQRDHIIAPKSHTILTKIRIISILTLRYLYMVNANHDFGLPPCRLHLACPYSHNLDTCSHFPFPFLLSYTCLHQCKWFVSTQPSKPPFLIYLLLLCTSISYIFPASSITGDNNIHHSYYGRL
jgi:hypothetical protein